MKELSKRIINRMEFYNIYGEKPQNQKELEYIYITINDKFVKITKQNLEEKYIYYSDYEVKIFKADLYSRNMGIANENEYNIRLKEIEAALDN